MRDGGGRESEDERERGRARARKKSEDRGILLLLLLSSEGEEKEEEEKRGRSSRAVFFFPPSVSNPFVYATITGSESRILLSKRMKENASMLLGLPRQLVVPPKRVEHGLGRLHPRRDRGVDALDARDDERARRAPEQRAAGEVEPGQRLPPALVERPRAVGGAGPALEELADLWVGLEALELLCEGLVLGKKERKRGKVERGRGRKGKE